MAAASFAVPGWAAVWTGANGSDIADPGNWDGDVTASEMQFTSTPNANLTLGQDYAVFRVFANSGDGRNVTIDLSGHALNTTSTETGNRDFWRASRTTFCITNSGERATFTQTADMQMDNASKTDLTLVVAGENTVMNGSVINRGGDRFSLRVLDGATLEGRAIAMAAANYSTNIVANGAALIGKENVNLAAGADVKAHDAYGGLWHGDVLTVSNATLSGANLFVAFGHPEESLGAPYGNALVAEAGATVSFTNANLACATIASNNVIRIADSGTTFSISRDVWFGTRICSNGTTSRYYATLPAMNNEFIIENGATAYVKNTYVGAGGNVLRVSSGATYEGVPGGVVQICSDMSKDFIAAVGAIPSRIEVVGGTLHFMNQISIGTRGVTNEVYGHELFVGVGGRVTEKTIHFYGVGDSLVVSNGTLETSGLCMGDYGGKRNAVRIMGESAHMRASGWIVDGTDAIFEFSIPETPWTVAPFHILTNVTVPKDFTLRLDETALDALKAYMKARKTRHVTVPLIRAANDAGWAKTIEVADMDALSANLPQDCTLQNENGVMSVTVSIRNGFVLTVR